MSFISKALSSVHLGGISNLWRGMGIQGLIRASASKKSRKFLGYLGAAGSVVSGASAMGAFSGAGAAGGSGSGALTEFGTGAGQDASLTALNGGAAAAGTGPAAASPSWMKYARMGNSVLQNQQDTQNPAPQASALQAPASDALVVPQKKSFIGTALTALQTGRPQSMGGADAPTALQ